MKNSSDLYKIVIPFFLFLGLIVFQANLMDIWHPEEANIALNHALHNNPSSLLNPDLDNHFMQAPFPAFMHEIGVAIFSSSIWSIRWSSVLAWILFIVLLYNAALFIIGSQAAKYTLVVALMATPLIMGIQSHPVGLWIVLGNTLVAISIFHLIDIQSPKIWLLYLWLGILIGLANGSIQALLLASILYFILPSEYKKSVGTNLKYKRFWVLLLVTITIWTASLTFVSSGSLYTYNWDTFLGHLFNITVIEQPLMLFNFVIWGCGFIVLIPSVAKHVTQGIKKRKGKLYILSVWFILSIVGFFHPMGIIAPISLLMGLSIYAIQKKYISKKQLKLWAILQIFSIIAFLIILLLFVNNQFGFWGIMWGVIGGVILLISIIFYLLMTESQNESLAAQGLLGLNALFMFVFFFKIFPLFSPSLSECKTLSLHLNDSNAASNVVLVDADLALDPALKYQLNRQIKTKNIIIQSSKDLTPNQYEHFSIIGGIHLPSQLSHLDTSKMTKERFTYWEFSPMEQKEVWIFMK